LALAVVLAQPWADVVLSGAATLRSNLAAAELARPAGLEHFEADLVCER
jgi:hypothetical protein